MLRTAAATALLGLAAAIAAGSIHLGGATTGLLIRRWWPVVLVTAGATGLRRGLGSDYGGRWVPLIMLLVGLALLASSALRIPTTALVVAGILAYAGVWLLIHHRDEPEHPRKR